MSSISCPKCGFDKYSIVDVPIDTQLQQSPRIQELLHCNICSSDTEIIHIEADRPERSALLRDLDEKIQMTQATLDLLKQEREKIFGENDKYTMLFHPIRRIPRRDSPGNTPCLLGCRLLGSLR